MYRVLIADDENSVIQSLRASVDWSSMQLEVAGTASDGEEALRLVRELGIDIAILDIRMPGFSGLELCAKLRAANSRIQLLLISGYAEFAYAEKAIQYGVIAYCLKPLDYEKVTQTLLKGIKNLKALDHSYDPRNLLEMISAHEDDEVRDLLRSAGFSDTDIYPAVSVGGSKLAVVPEAGQTIHLGRNKWGYLFKNLRSDSWFLDKCRLFGISGFGVLQQSVQISELKPALELCSAMACQFFIDPAQLICHESADSQADSWNDRILQQIQEGSWNRISAILKEIRDSGMQDFTARSALRLCNLIYSIPLFRDMETDHYLYSIEQLVSEYGSFENMLDTLCRLIESISLRMDGVSFSNSAFMKLLLYINQNYRSDISLSSAAQELHMTPNYISQLFKKETGDTFVHYITQKRLDDAKRLLLTTQKPVTDIAIEVGFNDYFYFNRIFRKNLGITPSQFREQG